MIPRMKLLGLTKKLSTNPMNGIIYSHFYLVKVSRLVSGKTKNEFVFSCVYISILV